MYHQQTPGDVPVTFLLSPIKELSNDSASLNNTLHPNSPSTIQLAQALSTGLVTASPSISRIITANAAEHSDTSVVNSQMPTGSIIIPTTTTSGSLTISPEESSIINEGPSTSVSSRRKRFDVTRKESVSKSLSMDSTSALSSKQASNEANDKRDAEGGDAKTGEVYV